MKAKRVVHLLPNLNSGGCENQLLRVLPKVEGIEHIVVTLLDEGSLADRFRSAGVKVVNLNLANYWRIWRLGRLKGALNKYRPDLVISYLFVPDMIGRLIVKPFMGYVPIPFLRSTYEYPSLTFRGIRLAERLTKPLVSRYLANSASVKQAFVKGLGVDSKKITVIHNGIEAKKFKDVSVPDSLRHELGIKKDTQVITCVANLHPNKGHRYLVEAFASLAKDHPKASLLLVGDGIERQALERQVDDLGLVGRVLFLGRRTDVPAILALSDIFVLPTFFEGMSNAIMEAMASGLACLVTDIEPNHELIKSGENGLFFPVRNSKILARCLRELLEDKRLREKLGRVAQQTIQREYDIDVVAKQFGTFLEKYS